MRRRRVPSGEIKKTNIAREEEGVVEEKKTPEKRQKRGLAHFLCTKPFSSVEMSGAIFNALHDGRNPFDLPLIGVLLGRKNDGTNCLLFKENLDLEPGTEEMKNGVLHLTGSAPLNISSLGEFSVKSRRQGFLSANFFPSDMLNVPKNGVTSEWCVFEDGKFLNKNREVCDGFSDFDFVSFPELTSKTAEIVESFSKKLISGEQMVKERWFKWMLRLAKKTKILDDEKLRILKEVTENKEIDPCEFFLRGIRERITDESTLNRLFCCALDLAHFEMEMEKSPSFLARQMCFFKYLSLSRDFWDEYIGIVRETSGGKTIMTVFLDKLESFFADCEFCFRYHGFSPDSGENFSWENIPDVFGTDLLDREFPYQDNANLFALKEDILSAFVANFLLDFRFPLSEDIIKKLPQKEQDKIRGYIKDEIKIRMMKLRKTVSSFFEKIVAEAGINKELAFERERNEVSSQSLALGLLRIFRSDIDSVEKFSWLRRALLAFIFDRITIFLNKRSCKLDATEELVGGALCKMFPSDRVVNLEIEGRMVTFRNYVSDNEETTAYTHEQPSEKDRLSYLRKIVQDPKKLAKILDGKNIIDDETRACLVVHETNGYKDDRESIKSILKEGVLLSKQVKQKPENLTEFPVTLDMMRSVLCQVKEKFANKYDVSLEKYVPTPLENQRFPSKRKGGSDFIEMAKFYVVLRKKESKEVVSSMEIQIIPNGLQPFRDKKQKDSDYKWRRVLWLLHLLYPTCIFLQPAIEPSIYNRYIGHLQQGGNNGKNNGKKNSKQ